MMKRERVTISLSHRNADAVAVMEAIKGIPERKRSAALLRWAAAYLSGEALSLAPVTAEPPAISDDELDALLNDF